MNAPSTTADPTPTRPTRGSLAHGVTVAGVHMRVAALNELQYRSNLFLQLVQSAFTTASALFVIAVVFDNTGELNGWDRPQLLAAVGVFTIVGGIMRTIVIPGVEQMMRDVQEGTFDFVLTRPADAQLLAGVRRFNFWQLVDVVVGLVIVLVAIPDLPSGLTAGDVAAFVALLVVAAVIVYCFLLTISCGVFWVVRMPYMDNLFYYITRTGQYPITIYPQWLRVGLTVVIPFGIAVTAPAEAIVSRLNWGTVLSALGVAIGLTLLCRWVWTRAVRRYAGASA
jgi:ABC-2 type transport system permease protein